MRNLFVVAVLLSGIAGTAPAQGAPLVELTVGSQSHEGTPVAHNESLCWLVGRDGTQRCLDLTVVTSFRKLPGEFRSLSVVTMAGQMRKELGRQFEVQTRGNHIVCAPQGKTAAYADTLDNVARTFTGYFSRRGWSLEQPQFPLVVIVYPSKEAFDESCRLVGIPTSPLLKGYYHPQSNRVLMFHQDQNAIKAAADDPASVSPNTIVHEAIHQLAFNSGLHSRMGESPRWVVEGLATMLEAGALKKSQSSHSTSARVNSERLATFRDYKQKRRSGTIAEFIAQEEFYLASAPLDYYSQAWALTFYLAEQRRPDYVRYLKRIAGRDPLGPKYSGKDQLADFQECFGQDLRWLDVQFLRFIDSLEE